MNWKRRADGTPNVIYLESELIAQFGPGFRVVLPITDPYVAHHGALGSFAQVHLPPGIPVEQVRPWLLAHPGVTECHDRDTAARLMELPPDRMGDLVVSSGRDVVLGRTPDWHDLPQKCVALFKYGHTASARIFTGGYAECCVLAAGTGILRVPATLPDALAAMANCTTATVAAALRLVQITVSLPGSNALVFGAGALGLTACAMLREAGAKEVICCDIDPIHAERALAFGATRAMLPAELDSLNDTPYRGVDAALEFSGSSAAVAAAIAALRIGGTALLAGTVLPCPFIPLDPELVVRRMLVIRGLHNYAPRDLVTALRFLEHAQHRYELPTLIGESYPLAAINEAFATASRRPGFRIVVYP